MTPPAGDATDAALVERYRPIYQLHPEEMWYPCHPEDQLRCADLVRVSDGAVIIPALKDGAGSVADQLLCTALGLSQLQVRGVQLDQATINMLASGQTPSAHYLRRPDGQPFIFRRADDGLLAPYGYVISERFSPAAGTWFHSGAPNNPRLWLGGGVSAYAESVLQPPADVLRGAWQEPTTSAWVQRHRVAGTNYVDVIYTCFLAWNGSISMFAGQGEHPNDVETVAVRLRADNLDAPVRYYFQQHSGFSWYLPENVETRGERVVVYLARQSHECYPHPGRQMRLFGFADDLCAGGVEWDAPAQYMFRPQGTDAQGVDTDTLRCAINKDDPNGVILVPARNPGPLWQYVNYPFLARRPARVPLSDNDFVHQPFPLATDKWWPDEGPAGSSPPLSQKAANASAPGVLDSFFDAAAPYLGPSPQPTCGPSAEIPGMAAEPVMAAGGQVPAGTPPSAVPDTVLGSAIGGATGEQAPEGVFVDWRGAIGSYLLGQINSHLQAWAAALLPTSFAPGNVTLGPVSLSDVSVNGLQTILPGPVGASSPTVLTMSVLLRELDVQATVELEGSGIFKGSVTVRDLSGVMTATMVTPVAVPASEPEQWYVPYVGPLPYSYDTAPFAAMSRSATSSILSGTVDNLTLQLGTVSVDVGNDVINELIDLALQSEEVRSALGGYLATEIASALNSEVESIFSGTTRVG